MELAAPPMKQAGSDATAPGPVASQGGPAMHPPAYLYVVRISAGWAICCQRCMTTVTTTRHRDRADRLAVIHAIRCTATTQEATAR